MQRKVVLLLCVSFVATAGCQGFGGLFGPPEYRRQVAEQERQFSQEYDPYPYPDTAPEVIGGRPRDFQKPYPQPRRDQPDRWERSAFNPRNWFGGR
jgi:hypothetical protein